MLEIDERSQIKIDLGLKALQESEASSKIAFSSYTHAAFDQEARIVTGDIRWKAFADQASNLGCQLFPLTWEMQPPGALNEVSFLVPTKDEILKTRVRSGLASMSWWTFVTPEIQGRLGSSILDKSRWVSSKNLISKNLSISYPSGVVEQVLGRVELLESTYRKILAESLNKRLSEVSEELYVELSKDVFGDLTSEFNLKRLSYFGSDFGTKIADRAIQAANDKNLDQLAQSLGLSGKGIFIGGELGDSYMVTFNFQSKTFLKNRIDPRSGEVGLIGLKIEQEEISDLLESCTIRPTGKLFDGLLILGEDELVIHHGNDYGGPLKAKTFMPQASGEYKQLFPDNKDSFVPINFVSSGWGLHTQPASLASLFIWNLEPGLWQEKLIQAVKTGEVQKVDIFKEVAKC